MMTTEEIKKKLKEVCTPLPGKAKGEWFELLFFCEGYFGHITTEMVSAVRELQWEGFIN